MLLSVLIYKIMILLIGKLLSDNSPFISQLIVHLKELELLFISPICLCSLLYAVDFIVLVWEFFLILGSHETVFNDLLFVHCLKSFSYFDCDHIVFIWLSMLNMRFNLFEGLINEFRGQTFLLIIFYKTIISFKSSRI
jgi:hypothetical protein